jgi:putative nucleotidyltransferase with HDIG domain
LPGSPAHLVKRFFDVVTARELTSIEREFVAERLTPPTAGLFFAQDDADQRHGYEAALTAREGGGDDEVVVAALLHDVGKRHARLGAVGRALASVLILARLPLTRRMVTYRDHGPVAARELAAMSVPPLVVDFAEHHHGDRPDSIDPDTWRLLVAADQPRRRSSRPTNGAA